MTMPEGQAKFRRRRIVIQPGYQLRVAGTVLLCILGYSLLLGFLVFYPFQQQFASATSLEQQAWIARQVLALHQRLWPAVLVIATLVAIQSLFFTHRIVGPAYHLRRVIEGLAAGQYELRAHLRRWDRLKELEAAVNALGEALLEREQAQRTQAERLQAALGELQARLQGMPEAASLQPAVAELERMAGDTGQPN